MRSVKAAQSPVAGVPGGCLRNAAFGMVLVLWAVGSSAEPALTARIPSFHRDSSAELPATCSLAVADSTVTFGAAGLRGLTPEQVVARVKDRAGNYAVYGARMKPEAFGPPHDLYVFEIPAWLRLSEMVWYRLFSARTTTPSAEISPVYFDTDRIYAQGFPELHFRFEGAWVDLQGEHRKPVGSISLFSDPPGAEILVDGKGTGLTTPCVVDSLFAGPHSVEAHLEDYRFGRRTIVVHADSMVRGSFDLISDLDTVFIYGEADFGILVLPQQPVDVPYEVDSTVAPGLLLRLEPGAHRVVWDGGARFSTLDTVIEIRGGTVRYLDFAAERLYGGLRMVTFPPDARLSIGDSVIGIGDMVLPLPADTYYVRAARRGYEPGQTRVVVESDEVRTVRIALPKKPDRDEDGYLDSVDNCPDDYGIYDGCPAPRPWELARMRLAELSEEIRRDPLTVAYSVIGYLRRIPSDREFRDFVSRFDSGIGGGMNNYRGLVFGNLAHVSYKGLYVSLELGQWASGLRYRGADTLTLDTERGPYLVYYDSLVVEPSVFLASTALSAGFHLPLKYLHVVYTLGYQWEDIVVDDLRRARDGRLTRVAFDNDWWFHQIHFESNIKTGHRMMPCLYANFKLPFGPVKRTHWQSMQVGLMLKFPFLDDHEEERS